MPCSPSPQTETLEGSVSFLHHTPEEPDPIAKEDLELFRHFSDGEDTAEASVKQRRQLVIRALTGGRPTVAPFERTGWVPDGLFPWVRRASTTRDPGGSSPNSFVQTTISAKLTYATYNYVPDSGGRLKRERTAGFAPKHLTERRSRELVRIRRGVGTRRISKNPKSLMSARFPELGRYAEKRRFYWCAMCKSVAWRHMKRHLRCRNHQLVVVPSDFKAPAVEEEVIATPALGTEKYKCIKWRNVSFR